MRRSGVIVTNPMQRCDKVLLLLFWAEDPRGRCADDKGIHDGAPGHPSPSDVPRYQRAKSDQFQESWRQFYRNSHKTQVSLCFFTLSLLTSCISATPVTGTADLQICLNGLKDAIEKSDAMLYTPSTTNQTDRCTHKVLQCYMLELKVIFHEEEVDINKTQCFFHFNETLSPEKNCSECEVYPLKNSTTFYNSFKHILEKLTTEQKLM